MRVSHHTAYPLPPNLTHEEITKEEKQYPLATPQKQGDISTPKNRADVSGKSILKSDISFSFSLNLPVLSHLTIYLLSLQLTPTFLSGSFLQNPISST